MLKTAIEREGQPYVDDPVYVRPNPVSLIQASVARAFGIRLPVPLQIGYERVRLRWRKPDGKGGLRPMNNCTATEEQECYRLTKLNSQAPEVL